MKQPKMHNIYCCVYSDRKNKSKWKMYYSTNWSFNKKDAVMAAKLLEQKGFITRIVTEKTVYYR